MDVKNIYIQGQKVITPTQVILGVPLYPIKGVISGPTLMDVHQNLINRELTMELGMRSIAILGEIGRSNRSSSSVGDIIRRSLGVSKEIEEDNPPKSSMNTPIAYAIVTFTIIGSVYVPQNLRKKPTLDDIRLVNSGPNPEKLSIEELEKLEDNRYKLDLDNDFLVFNFDNENAEELLREVNAYYKYLSEESTVFIADKKILTEPLPERSPHLNIGTSQKVSKVWRAGGTLKELFDSLTKGDGGIGTGIDDHQLENFALMTTQNGYGTFDITVVHFREDQIREENVPLDTMYQYIKDTTNIHNLVKCHSFAELQEKVDKLYFSVD